MPRTSEDDPLQGEWKGLQTLYNQAVRAMLHVSLKDHRKTKELFHSAGLLSINQLACQAILSLVWKTASGKCQGAQGLFQKRSCSSHMHTRSQESMWLEGNNRSKLTKQSLQSTGAKLWNLCPKELKNTIFTLDHVPKRQIRELVTHLPFEGIFCYIYKYLKLSNLIAV